MDRYRELHHPNDDLRHGNGGQGGIGRLLRTPTGKHFSQHVLHELLDVVLDEFEVT